MKRIGLTLITILLVASPLFAQTVSIPDTAFLYALIEEAVDTNEDSLINYDEAEAVVSLEVGFSGISDMTGIEAFVNLDTLDCSFNHLTSLDVSGCSTLYYLDCSHNDLNSQDVSGFSTLYYLDCSGNDLTSLDVSGFATLYYLDCSNNARTSLDVTNNTALIELFCDRNQLTSLDLSQNTALIRLDCDDNQLTSLDVSNNTALIRLDCDDNQLTSLDVSNNTALTDLRCKLNQLTSLDVSNNTALRGLNFHNNQLTSLDLSNNLALYTLSCGNNQLNSLDLSQNTALISLHCFINQLTSLDVTNNTALIELICDRNQLTSLDVSNNTALTDLRCSGNQLTSLNVSRSIALEELDISDMITLYEVFVWELFPFGVRVETTGSPNVFFTYPEIEHIKNIRFGSTGDPLNGLTIAWKSEGAADSIAWGYTSGLENGEYAGVMSTSIIGTQFEYTFPTVPAGSTIHYTIFNSKDGVWTEERIYNTASDASSDQFSFTVLGDSRSNPDQWGIIADATLDTDFTLFMGDIINNGAAESDWKAWFEYGEKFISREPIYHCVGNHDDDNSPSGFDNFLGLFTLPGNELYYSFTYGNAVFICLNSEEPENTDQYNWLLSTLEANKDHTWKIVFFHKPFYTSGSHEGEMDGYFDTWWQAFDDYGVDMIFNGHTHNYQRTKPINRNVSITSPVNAYGKIGNGRCQIVSGAAGAPLKVAADPGLWWLDNSASTMHFCNIEINGDLMTFKALDANQVVFDELVLVNTGIEEDTKINSDNEPLFKNYPNPFQSSTIITYQLPAISDVELSVYDISGRKVAILVSEMQRPDKYEVEWNAESMESGIYFCVLKTGLGRQVTKMIKVNH